MKMVNVLLKEQMDPLLPDAENRLFEKYFDIIHDTLANSCGVCYYKWIRKNGHEDWTTESFNLFI